MSPLVPVHAPGRNDLVSQGPPPFADRPEPPSDLLPLGEVFRVSLRHKLLIVLTLLLGVGAGTAYYLLAPPRYMSKAKVLVVKKEPYRFASDVESQVPMLQDDDEVHLSVLASPMLISRTVTQRNLYALPTFLGMGDPTGAILKSLSVTRVSIDTAVRRGNTHVIALSFTGPYAEDGPLVVGAILDGYRAFLEDTARKINEEAILRITKKAEDVERNLRAKEAEYREFRKRLPAAAKESMRQHETRITEIEGQRTSLAVRQAQVERRLAAAHDALSSDKDAENFLASLHEPARRELGLAMRQALASLMVREEELSKRFGADHPDIQLVRRQIDMVRKLYVPASSTGAASLDPRDQIEAQITVLASELKDIQASEQELARTLERKRAEVRELEHHQFEDQRLASEITRARQFYQSLVDQQGGVDLSKDMIGYTLTVLSPPGKAVKVSPTWIWSLAVPAFLSLVVGSGLAWLAEASDRSFRNPHDITWRIGLPVVAHIPVIDRSADKAGLNGDLGKPNVLDPIVCSFYRPMSAAAEAFRALRAAICFPSHRERFRVIQVSSPADSDGKTSVACNLAVSLAHLGGRVLLVDADLRSGRIHEVFGLSGAVGLTSVCEGRTDLAGAVLESTVNGLWILAAGPPAANPADLLSSVQFERFLDLARSQYDYVIIDSPALLAVTDPRVVAPLVDGVLLTIRVVKNGRPTVERACEILGMIQANLLGVVVNGKDCYRHYSDDGYLVHPRQGPAPAGDAAIALSWSAGQRPTTS